MSRTKIPWADYSINPIKGAGRHLMSKRLLVWVMVGFPVYLINYVLFVAVLWASGSVTLAFWSWILASPLTLKMWDIFELKSKELVL